MASDEARRRDENASGEAEVHVEKDMVPKLTTHFESLAEKSGGDQERAGGDGSQSQNPQFEPKESANGSREGGEEEGGREGGSGTPSLDEVSKLRAMAQQNSFVAIRGAEERYARETEASSQGLGTAAASFVKEKGEKAKEAAVDTGKVTAAKASNVVVLVKDTAIETGKTAATKAGEVLIGAKDKAATAGMEAGHYVSEKTVEAAKAAGGYVAEKAVSAKDVVAEKAVSAKDAVAEKVVSAKDTVTEKAASAKDVAAEKAALAKDAAAEKAALAKDAATEKVVSAKDAATEKAVSAKDTVTEKTVSAKDTVAGTTMEFIGKNKEEAESKGKTGEGESKGERGIEPMEEAKREEEKGGILEAIGETVVEIAQTAKDYVAGGKGGQRDPQQTKQ